MPDKNGKLTKDDFEVLEELGIHFALVIVKFTFVSNAIRVGRNKAVHRCFLVCFQHATRPDGRAKWIPYLEEWLKTHPSGGMGCPTCGNRLLNLHDQLVAMAPTDGKSPHQTGQGKLVHSLGLSLA